jgi:hypothetical protein
LTFEDGYAIWNLQKFHPASDNALCLWHLGAHGAHHWLGPLCSIRSSIPALPSHPTPPHPFLGGEPHKLHRFRPPLHGCRLKAAVLKLTGLVSALSVLPYLNEQFPSYSCPLLSCSLVPFYNSHLLCCSLPLQRALHFNPSHIHLVMSFIVEKNTRIQDLGKGQWNRRGGGDLGTRAHVAHL